MTTVLPLRPLARAAAAAALAGGLLLAGALPAGAHVHVEADDATAGGYAVLTFRVPNESDTAGTVAVEATLPNDNPFLSVSSKPLPGWTVSTTEAALPKPVVVEGTTITKAVRTVTWKADKGSQIGPGEFQEFELSVGPLPGAGQIAIPVAQTYSDGKVVTWNQPTPASGDEPENPVPTFTVGAAAADDHGTGSASPSVMASTAEGGQPAPAAQTAASGGSDPLARVLGALGLAAGVGALVVALVGRRRGAA